MKSAEQSAHAYSHIHTTQVNTHGTWLREKLYNRTNALSVWVMYIVIRAKLYDLNELILIIYGKNKNK